MDIEAEVRAQSSDTEETLLMRLMPGAADAALGRNVLNLARRKLALLTDACRQHICGNPTVMAFAQSDSDLVALAVLLANLIPKHVFQSSGIADEIAACVLIARMGILKVCSG